MVCKVLVRKEKVGKLGLVKKIKLHNKSRTSAHRREENICKLFTIMMRTQIHHVQRWLTSQQQKKIIQLKKWAKILNRNFPPKEDIQLGRNCSECSECRERWLASLGTKEVQDKTTMKHHLALASMALTQTKKGKRNKLPGHR